MVRLIPASCFHTGSARFKLSGLPVRMAMPNNTPDCSKQKVRILEIDEKLLLACSNTPWNISSALRPWSLLNQNYPN